MRTLIVEDDFTSRKLLYNILSDISECDIAVDGEEAIHAFKLAWEEEAPYDLICMDIMMPNIDGQEALRKIRQMEKEMGVGDKKEVKIIMVTALGDPKTVVSTFYEGGATGYVVKPIHKRNILEEIRKMNLIK